MNRLRTLVVFLVVVVTTSSTIRSLPTTWNTFRGLPLDFFKPLNIVFDSMLCPELLNILGQTKLMSTVSLVPNNSSQPSSPLLEADNSSSLMPTQFSTSNNVFPKFTTSCETPPTLNQIEPNNNNSTSDKPEQFIETLVFDTNPLSSNRFGLSNVDWVLQNNNQNTESAVQTPLPHSASLLTSFLQPPAPITSPSTYTTFSPIVSHSAPLPSSSPFPGSTLLHIEPLKLSTKHTQELLKLLSSFSMTTLQTTSQDPYQTPILLLSSVHLSKTPRILSSSSSTMPSSTVSQSPPTPYDSLVTLLSLLTNPSSTINESNSNFGYTTPSFKSNLPSTSKSNNL